MTSPLVMTATTTEPSWWHQVTTCNEQAPALPPAFSDTTDVLIRHERGPSLWVWIRHDDGDQRRLKWLALWQPAPSRSGNVCRFVDLDWPLAGGLRIDLDTGKNRSWTIRPDDLAVLRQALNERRAPGELGGRNRTNRPQQRSA